MAPVMYATVDADKRANHGHSSFAFICSLPICLDLLGHHALKVLLSKPLLWNDVVLHGTLAVDLTNELDVLPVVERSNLMSEQLAKQFSSTALGFSGPCRTHLDKSNTGDGVGVREQVAAAVAAEVAVNRLAAVGSVVVVDLGLALGDLHLGLLALEVERASVNKAVLYSTHWSVWSFWHVSQ